MKAFIYFQPNAKRDNFEATRLRKSIKGACELSDIDYTTSVLESSDLAHFLSVDNEVLIDEMINSKKPVVISALYTECDPSAQFMEFNKKGERHLKSKALKILNKVNLILVPSEIAKKALISEGVTSQIEVLNCGVAPTRFVAVSEAEKNIFPRYFSIKEGEHTVLTTVEVNSKQQIDDIIYIAKNCPEYRFFCVGISKSNFSFRRRLRTLTFITPKNLTFIPIVEDDVYRSAMMYSDCYLNLNKVKANLITSQEAMAAHTQIFAYKNDLNNQLASMQLLRVCSTPKEMIKALKTYYQNHSNSTAETAYLYAKSNSLSEIGLKLKKYYEDLLSIKEENK